ncbi:MAG: MBL fold metallo-hydrolase [Planctomycetota bacterium]|nr:MBL fold metallo-hydrolase [Planctomycetota bacterium]
MILRQFLDTDPVVAASYLVGCAGKGISAVIDPVRPVDRYVEVSREHGMAIQYVIDTHVHADHLSGGRELAQAVNASYVLGPASGAAFDHLTVTDTHKLHRKRATRVLAYAGSHP